MGKVSVNPRWIQELCNEPKVKSQIMAVAEKVRSNAASTASAAENGPGGTITGYASAGFSVTWDTSRRPQARVYSNAPKDTFMKVYWYTQKRDGVTHLRNALYKEIR